MIPLPPGWKVDQLPRGLALTHPRGRELATIHYRERIWPLRRLGATVDEILAATPGFAVQSVAPPERLLTVEGEHAALVTATGSQDGAPAQRDLGFVFGDDFYAALVGLCLHTDERARMTALVRELLRADMQFLGVRRRRFEYAPPPGWEPLARDLLVEWYPPDFPRDAAGLRVHPGYPIAFVPWRVGPETIARHHRERGMRVDDQRPPRPIATPRGLAGSAHDLRVAAPGGPAMAKTLVVLSDARYHYVLELASSKPETWAEHTRTLDAVVASVVPIPLARSEDMAATVSFWSC